MRTDCISQTLTLSRSLCLSQVIVAEEAGFAGAAVEGALHAEEAPRAEGAVDAVEGAE